MNERADAGIEARSAEQSSSVRTKITPVADRRITKQTEQILTTLMTDPTAEWSGSQIAPAAGLKSGTLYPALIRMHRFGWLSWRWEDVEYSAAKRPRKRLYRLTAEGERVSIQVATEHAVRARRRARASPTRPLPGIVTP
jgi:PadR family transcriptional regulator, regulatory protein PadR